MSFHCVLSSQVQLEWSGKNSSETNEQYLLQFDSNVIETRSMSRREELFARSQLDPS